MNSATAVATMVSQPVKSPLFVVTVVSQFHSDRYTVLVELIVCLLFRNRRTMSMNSNGQSLYVCVTRNLWSQRVRYYDAKTRKEISCNIHPYIRLGSLVGLFRLWISIDFQSVCRLDFLSHVKFRAINSKPAPKQ